MEFLNNAMEIEIYTRRKCKRFPKTERFTTSARLIGLAAEAAGHLSRGNDIYPATQHDAQRRRAHFMDARGVYADMIREVEVCCRVDGINMDIRPAWMAMIAKEITRINGVIDADRKRYKNLPQ